MKIKMEMKKKAMVFVSSLMIGSLCLPLHLAYARPSVERETYVKKTVSPFLDLINENFYKTVDTEKMFQEVIETSNEKTNPETVLREIVKKLKDPYSDFFTEEELNSFNSSMKGSFFGIGVSVQKAKSGEVLVNEVFKKSPAEEAGLKKGDLIFKVAEEDVTNMELQSVITLIKGEKGTKVRIAVKRGKKKFSFDVERREVIVPSVSAKLFKKSDIGLLRVEEFLDNTDEEFSEKLDSLEKRQIKGLIIDLRNNGGGYVDTAYNMLDRILPNGKVLYSYRYKKDLSMVFQSGMNSKEDKTLNLPIAILTNGKTASASEIFSGALKDHKVAEIFGEKTFGKGVAQSIFESNTGDLKGGIKLTVLNYLLPLGESIHEKGIEPTVIVHNKKDKKGKLLDYQLNEAIKFIKRKINKK